MTRYQSERAASAGDCSVALPSPFAPWQAAQRGVQLLAVRHVAAHASARAVSSRSVPMNCTAASSDAFLLEPHAHRAHLVPAVVLGRNAAHAGGEVLELPRQVPGLHARNLRRADAVVAIGVGAVTQQAVVELVARAGRSREQHQRGHAPREKPYHVS